jgi:hypothetical protein
MIAAQLWQQHDEHAALWQQHSCCTQDAELLTLARTCCQVLPLLLFSLAGTVQRSAKRPTAASAAAAAVPAVPSSSLYFIYPTIAASTLLGQRAAAAAGTAAAALAPTAPGPGCTRDPCLACCSCHQAAGRGTADVQVGCWAAAGGGVQPGSSQAYSPSPPAVMPGTS